MKTIFTSRAVAAVLAASVAVFDAQTMLANESDAFEIKDRYSYNEFTRLDRHTVDGLLNRFQLRKKAPSIVGFSDNMADHITSMLVHDWRSTQRLMRDLAKIESRWDREQRIQIEIDRIEKFRKSLDASISFQVDGGTQNPSGHNQAFWDELKRDRQAKYYLHGLKTWLQFPWEGTRK